MKKILLFCTAFAVFFGAALPGHCETKKNHVPVRMVSELMSWVRKQTGIAVPVLPTVIVSHERFIKVLDQHSVQAIGRPQSLYYGRMIVLDDETWNIKDARQVSLLVHELVHYAQDFSKTKWACSNAKEAQAYRLQNKWLVRNGYKPFATEAWIKQVSACGDWAMPTVELAQGQR